MNVSAKSGSKITGEDLLSRLQKKDGYIYAETQIILV
jgi:FtsZ-interacting cell division protein ZipA